MRVLIRIDFNGEYRIKEHLKTIKKYLPNNQVIICGHYGRPKDQDKNYSLNQFKYLLPKEVELLENLRFDPREEANDETFARELAAMADLFVQDAFSACHRRHASIVGVPKFVRSEMGLVLEKEIKALKREFKRPLVFIIGGGKVDTKLPLAKKLLEQADHLLLGGLIANMMLADSNITSTKLHLPVDAITEYGEKAVGEVKDKMQILDIGPDTRELFASILKEAKTIIWNGPMGKFEDERYDDGSISVARTVANINAYKIVGGGEVVNLIEDLKLKDKFNHVSTGGGAMLEFLANGILVGIQALNEKLAS